MDTLKITMEDMRAVDFCAAGVEAFFNREGLDYALFLKEGISAEELLNTGSVFARKVVNVKIKTIENKEEQ